MTTDSKTKRRSGMMTVEIKQTRNEQIAELIAWTYVDKNVRV